MMFGAILSFIAAHMLYFVLHLESGSFKKPLTAKEEAQAFIDMKNGDTTARDRLIEHNLRLVAHIVKKYYATTSDQEDLLSIGTIGLIKAVKSFDNTKGARFSTYASRCVENEIFMHFRAARKNQSLISAQESIDSAGDGGLTISDIVADDFVLDEAVEQKERTQQLYRVLGTLQGRERQIILLRYGLQGQPPLTQQQVCELLHISRSYVSRLEKKALYTMRTSMEKS